MNKKFFYFTINKSLFQFALDLLEIFGVINLFNIYDQSLLFAVLPFILIHLGYSFALPLLAKTLARIGTRTAMTIGSVFFLLAMIPLPFINATTIWPLLVWVILEVIARAFYFLPYHYFVNTLTSTKHRGKEMGFLRMFMISVSILVPIVGGIVSENFGIGGLGVVSGFVFLVSLIPLTIQNNIKFTYSGRAFSLLNLRAIKEAVEFSAVNAFQAVFGRFWVIWVFLILGGSFIGVGEIFTAVAIINVLVSYILGNLLDHHNRKKMIEVDAILIFFVWIGRALAVTPLGVLIADIAFKLNLNIKNSVLDVLISDLLTQKNQTAQLDERIVIREITVNLAYAGGTILALMLVSLFGFQTSFIAAGLIALLFTLI